MYRRIIEGLSTAPVVLVVFALLLAPSRDRGRIGQRLVAITRDYRGFNVFCGVPVDNVIRLAHESIFLPSPIDTAHLHRHFTEWCRTRNRLSPSQSVAALRVLAMAPRMSPTVVRRIFVDVRNVVTFLSSRDVMRVLVAMARCKCVDTALLSSLMIRLLTIASTWKDEEIAPAIFVIAHLRVVVVPVVDALVRRLRTFSIETQRRHTPKVVKALAKLMI